MKKIISIILIAFALISCNNEESTTEEKTVETTNAVGVKVQIAELETFKHFVELSGALEAENYAFISPQANGQITNIYVNEGDYVQKGKLLVQLNNSVIVNTISEVENSLDLATITFKKQEELWNQEIGSEIQFLQAKNQKVALERKLKTLNAQLQLTKIIAPFSGYVDNIRFKVGELAAPGVQLLEMVNLNKMIASIDVSERYLSNFNKGDSVEVTFPDIPKLKKISVIFRTGKIINPANRTFKVEVKLNNKDESLKPNLVTNVVINDLTIDSVIIIPSIAIKNDFDKQFIYIAKNKIANKIYVETGASFKDKTVITKGLNIGDMIIVDGYNLVSNNSEIRIDK